MKHYKLLSLALAFTLLFSLAACKPAAGEPTAVPTPEGTQAPTAQPTEEPSAAPTETPSSVEMPEWRIIAIWEQKAAVSVFDKGVNVCSAIDV